MQLYFNGRHLSPGADHNHWGTTRTTVTFWVSTTTCGVCGRMLLQTRLYDFEGSEEGK